MSVFRVSISKHKVYRQAKYLYTLRVAVSKKEFPKIKRSLFKSAYKTTKSTNLIIYQWAFLSRLQAQNAAKKIRKLYKK